MVDLKTLKTLSKVSTGQNPDAILYEPGQKEVYAFNGRGNSATVFNAVSGEVVATVTLPGKPEFAVSDPDAGRVYNNIEDKNVVVAIDTKTHQVANTWPIAHEDTPDKLTVVQTLATERGARTMTLDPKTHRIYLGAVKYESQPNQTPATPRGRPRAMPNSFRILVYGQ